MLFASLKRTGKLRALGMSAALDLGKFADKLPRSSVEPSLNSFSLGFQPKAALTLLIGTDPIIGHEPAPMGDHDILCRSGRFWICEWPDPASTLVCNTIRLKRKPTIVGGCATANSVLGFCGEWGDGATDHPA
jgi:hypothetical protein